MTDQDIIAYRNKYVTTHQKTSRFIIDLPTEYKKYLSTRYEDSNSLLESFYRIQHNIDRRPTCRCCHHPVTFINLSRGYHTYYSAKCSMKDPATIHKMQSAMKEKYNVTWYSKSDDYKKKIHEVSIKKYGCWHFTQSDVVRQNSINAVRKKYGVDYVFQSDVVKQKICNTNLQRYGVENISQNKDIAKRKSVKMASTESQAKHNQSLKKNQSYRKSNFEEMAYMMIKEKYPDVQRQFRSEQYPFNCDFYIPSLDLYIEIQGSQYHHFHPYDPTNLNDVAELDHMKKKSVTHRQYNSIIQTWTITDPYKRKTAKENGVNLIEFWNIDEIKKWLDR